MLVRSSTPDRRITYNARWSRVPLDIESGLCPCNDESSTLAAAFVGVELHTSTYGYEIDSQVLLIYHTNLELALYHMKIL